MKRGVHAVAWVVLAVAAFLLWPERWGGAMTYVITSGTSMEPSFMQGDLAILRSADDYAVGDVAAYDSSDLKRIVMHRITEESEKGYTFQGDNNHFHDPETVTDEQMLGKLVLRVPGVGDSLTWFLKPINVAIAAAALFFLLADRKKEPPEERSKSSLTHLRLRSLQLPVTVVTAEVDDEAELGRLATHLERPVLEVDGQDRRYVVDAGIVYTWQEPGMRSRERRRTAQPLDSAYAGYLESIPQPRSACFDEDVVVNPATFGGGAVTWIRPS